MIVRLSTWCPHCREQLVNIYPLDEGLKIKKDAVPYIILRDRNGKIVHNQSGVHSMNSLMDVTGAMLESYDEFKEKFKEPVHPL